MLSPQTEEYLECIFKLQNKEDGLRVSQLSDALGVSAAAVTDMLKKLRERQFVVSDNEVGGIKLTSHGEDEAKAIVRKHRLTERFLTDILGMPWETVHDEACKLEHALGPEVVERLNKLLDNPETCPHGYPVPGSDGTIKAVSAKPLIKLKPGQSGEIISVSEDNPQMLQYLASLGLMPGTTIEVIEVAPFNGPFLVSIQPPKAQGTNLKKTTKKSRGSRYALGQEVAAKISVGGS